MSTLSSALAEYLQKKEYNYIFDYLKGYVDWAIWNNVIKMKLVDGVTPDDYIVRLCKVLVVDTFFEKSCSSGIVFHAFVVLDIWNQACYEQEEYIDGKTTCVRKDWMCEECIEQRTVKVSFTAGLGNELCNLNAFNVEPCWKTTFDIEARGKQSLIPYIHETELDYYAEQFLSKYYSAVFIMDTPVDVGEIYDNMQLHVCSKAISDDVFAKIYFSADIAEVYAPNAGNELVSEQIEAGTVLLNSRMSGVVRDNFTLIHESVHWEFHRKQMLLLNCLVKNACLPEEIATAISCYKDASYLKRGVIDYKRIEWQADNLAARILMPRKQMRDKLAVLIQNVKRDHPTMRRACVLELAIKEVADFFDVSVESARIRALQLGFDQAAGVLRYIDGQYVIPIWFPDGYLTNKQTFFIDERTKNKSLQVNSKLKKAFENGTIVYINKMFVMNTPKFVRENENGVFQLTEYALEHAEECALCFDINSKMGLKEDTMSYSVYHLDRDVDRENFTEYFCDLDADINVNKIKDMEELEEIMKMIDHYVDLRNNDLPGMFHNTLKYHMDRLECNARKLAEKTHQSQRTIENHLKGENMPELPAVLSYCVGLNLHPFFSLDLIHKADKSLFPHSRENCFFLYLIFYHHYKETIDMWNWKLREVKIDQLLPGNGRKDAKSYLEKF